MIQNIIGSILIIPLNGILTTLNCHLENPHIVYYHSTHTHTHIHTLPYKPKMHPPSHTYIPSHTHTGNTNTHDHPLPSLPRPPRRPCKRCTAWSNPLQVQTESHNPAGPDSAGPACSGRGPSTTIPTNKQTTI